MSRNKEIERRSWWRNHFEDHPGAATKAPDSYVESDTGNTKSCKVYCKACFVADVEQIMLEDLSAIDQGRVAAIRTEHAVKTHCKLIVYGIYHMLMISVKYGRKREQVLERDSSAMLH